MSGQVPKCKICDSPSELLFSLPRSKRTGDKIPHLPNDANYYRCINCDFLFSDIIDNIDNTEIYDDEYWTVQDPDWGGRVGQSLRLLMFAAQLTHKKIYESEILDFGCGMGSLIEAGRALDLRIWGTDIIEPKFGKEFFLYPNFSQKFDIIIACEVIEHLPFPVQTFSSIFDSLKPGGVFAFQTAYYDPNLCDRSWWYIGPGNGHISLYSRRAFEILASILGVKQKRIWNNYAGIQCWKKSD